MRLLLILLIGFPAVLAPQGSLASMRVDVVDPFGNPVKNAKVTLTTANGTPLDAVSLVPLDVPFGEYSVRIVGSNSERRILVNASSIIAKIARPFRPGDTVGLRGGLTIRGQALGTEGTRLQWARLVGTYLPVQEDRELSVGGTFQFSDLDMGSYTILVFSAKRIEYACSLEIDPKKPVVDVRLRVTNKLGHTCPIR